MGQRFFVLMQAMSGNDRHEIRFEHYNNLEEAEAMVQEWMSRYMAVSCIPFDQVEQTKAQYGGQLPESLFPCPEVKEPKDLMQYNGYYNLGGLGLIFHVFLTVVWDKESALAFRGAMNREFRIDAEYSERSDRMMAHLKTLVDSFENPDLDITEAEAAIRDFWRNDGFNPFEAVDVSPEWSSVPDNSSQWDSQDGKVWIDSLL